MIFLVLHQYESKTVIKFGRRVGWAIKKEALLNLSQTKYSVFWLLLGGLEGGNYLGIKLWH